MNNLINNYLFYRFINVNYMINNVINYYFIDY